MNVTIMQLDHGQNFGEEGIRDASGERWLPTIGTDAKALFIRTIDRQGSKSELTTCRGCRSVILP
jgi:hypothetical protein